MKTKVEPEPFDPWFAPRGILQTVEETRKHNSLLVAMMKKKLPAREVNDWFGSTKPKMEALIRHRLAGESAGKFSFTELNEILTASIADIRLPRCINLFLEHAYCWDLPEYRDLKASVALLAGSHHGFFTLESAVNDLVGQYIYRIRISKAPAADFGVFEYAGLAVLSVAHRYPESVNLSLGKYEDLSCATASDTDIWVQRRQELQRRTALLAANDQANKPNRFQP